MLSVFDRQYARWPYLTLSDWKQNVSAVKYYARIRQIGRASCRERV